MAVFGMNTDNLILMNDDEEEEEEDDDDPNLSFSSVGVVNEGCRKQIQ
jgi:hypothetical protein